MRIEDIRLFIRVAESGSISRTANECYISQQGLSRIISNFEQTVGVKLFHRGSRTIRLTSDGESVLRSAREVEKAYINMIDGTMILKAKYSTDWKAYTIYATPLICYSLLPGIINTLTERFPGFRFNIIEKTGLDILESVRFEENIIAIVSIIDFLERDSLRLKNGDIVFEKYYSDNIQILVHEESPVAGKPVITRDELSKMPLAVHGSQDLLVSQLLGDYFDPWLVTNTDNFTLCRTIVENGFAAGFTTQLTEFYLNRNSPVTSVPVDCDLTIHYGCIYGLEQHLGEFGGEVRRIIKDVLRLIRKS